MQLTVWSSGEEMVSCKPNCVALVEYDSIQFVYSILIPMWQPITCEIGNHFVCVPRYGYNFFSLQSIIFACLDIWAYIKFLLIWERNFFFVSSLYKSVILVISRIRFGSLIFYNDKITVQFNRANRMTHCFLAIIFQVCVHLIINSYIYKPDSNRWPKLKNEMIWWNFFHFR